MKPIVLGRFVKDRKKQFHHKGENRAEVLHREETFDLDMPSKLTVMIYRSDVHHDWVVNVMVHAVDVETGDDGYFGCKWRYDNYPTRLQILAQVIHMLTHEMQHQLGLPAHPETP